MFKKDYCIPVVPWQAFSSLLMFSQPEITSGRFCGPNIVFLVKPILTYRSVANIPAKNTDVIVTVVNPPTIIDGKILLMR